MVQLSFRARETLFAYTAFVQSSLAPTYYLIYNFSVRDTIVLQNQKVLVLLNNRSTFPNGSESVQSMFELQLRPCLDLNMNLSDSRFGEVEVP